MCKLFIRNTIFGYIDDNNFSDVDNKCQVRTTPTRANLSILIALYDGTGATARRRGSNAPGRCHIRLGPTAKLPTYSVQLTAAIPRWLSKQPIGVTHYCGALLSAKASHRITARQSDRSRLNASASRSAINIEPPPVTPTPNNCQVSPSFLPRHCSVRLPFFKEYLSTEDVTRISKTFSHYCDLSRSGSRVSDAL